jgi:ATP/maltotriose-dependent transcriptional regulator MalT
MAGQAQPSKAGPRERRIIERPRLLKLLEESDARLIVLTAPAGYGKTTLARQWMRSQSQVAWYTCGTGARDVAEFAASLASALDECAPGLRAYVGEIIATLKTPMREVVKLGEAFSRRIAGDDPQLSLVIDDYHHVSGSVAPEALAQQLYESTSIRLVIASRGRPSWVTARNFVYGEALEITREVLAMDEHESAQLLGGRRPKHVRALREQARGWPAVLGLAALADEPRAFPAEAVPATLYHFFAEELFQATPTHLRDVLPTLALLPSLAPHILNAAIGPGSETVLAEAQSFGFLATGNDGMELHPLLREFLLEKLIGDRSAHRRTREAVELSLHLGEWPAAFDMIKRFRFFDLVDQLIAASYKELVAAGRLTTLEGFVAFAREASEAPTAVMDLVDAEIAHRQGRYARAEEVATRAARQLGLDNELTSHAYCIAGAAASLMYDQDRATTHFAKAYETARDDSDATEALWGNVVASIFGERDDVDQHLTQFIERRDRSPRDFVRAVSGTLQAARWRGGLGAVSDLEAAHHAVAHVADPLVRSSFLNQYAYYLGLTGRYIEGLAIAREFSEIVETYSLSFARPHAHWNLAFTSLGLRRFGDADHWLQRVERSAEEMDDVHLSMNARALRARMLLALQRATEASKLVEDDVDQPVNRAMVGEYIATRALAAVVAGDDATGVSMAESALELTAAVETQVLAVSAQAVADVMAGRPYGAQAAMDAASRLDTWDPLVCALRAWPPLLVALAETDQNLPRLRRILRESRDHDLAVTADIFLGDLRRVRATLSRREHEVWQLLRQGLTNKQIAQALFISESTAKVHVRHILEKLDARTRTEAASRLLED